MVKHLPIIYSLEALLPRPWPSTLQKSQVPGVGGPFNPATLDSAEGFLAAGNDGNEDGCDVFHERLDGKVLLVKRGNCFFQVRFTD